MYLNFIISQRAFSNQRQPWKFSTWVNLFFVYHQLLHFIVHSTSPLFEKRDSKQDRCSWTWLFTV